MTRNAPEWSSTRLATHARGRPVRRSVRRPVHRPFHRLGAGLAVAACLALALVGVAAPETTASVAPDTHRHRHAPYLTDVRGDVTDDYEHPCVDPDTDVVRVDVTRDGRRAVVVHTRYAALAPGRWLQAETVSFLTPGASWSVQAEPHVRGAAPFVVDGPRPGVTHAVGMRFDRRAHEVVLTVPWRLIGRPRWARIGVASTRGDGCGGADDGWGHDLAGVRGSTPVDRYGPRVRRR